MVECLKKTTYEIDADLKIAEITLLSIDEYEAGKAFIPQFGNEEWWLRTPSTKYATSVAIVQSDGSVSSGPVTDFRALRPALRFKKLSLTNFHPGDIIVLAKREWTIITNDLAIANYPVDYSTWFNRLYDMSNDLNNYEGSDIKNRIEKWASNNGLVIEIAQPLGSIELNKLDIAEITLLSVEEYEDCKQFIPPMRHWWWLRSPALVYKDENSEDMREYDWIDYSRMTEYGIRPALRIGNLSGLNLKPGDEMVVADKKWTVISDDLAIINRSIEMSPFRRSQSAKNPSDYAKSDAKKSIEDWANKNGIVFKG